MTSYLIKTPDGYVTTDLLPSVSLDLNDAAIYNAATAKTVANLYNGIAIDASALLDAL